MFPAQDILVFRICLEFGNRSISSDLMLVPKRPGTVGNLPFNASRIPIINEAGKGDNRPEKDLPVRTCKRLVAIVVAVN